MNAMPTHITAWLTSTSHGVATADSTAATGAAVRLTVPASPGDRRRPLTAYAGAWLPKWDRPLMGEARVNTADAHSTRARSEASPGSTLPPVGDLPTWTSTPTATGAHGEPVHEEHGEVHDGMDQRVGQVEPEALHRLDRRHQEPHHQQREDDLPDGAAPEGPVAHEHAGHGHPHEHMGRSRRRVPPVGLVATPRTRSVML